MSQRFLKHALVLPVLICIALLMNTANTPLRAKTPAWIADQSLTGMPLPARRIKFDQTDKQNQLAREALQREAVQYAAANQPLKQAIRPPSDETTPSLYTRFNNWIIRKQTEISRTFTGYIERFQATNNYQFALWLITASLVYGLVHAAGPGHGKVVVSSYVMANNQTLRRGIVLAFLCALAQAMIAILLVGTLAFILGATGTTIKKYGLQMTQLSYLLIIALGAYLLVTALYRRFFSAKKSSHATTHDHGHHHDHQHDHQHEQGETCGCGHSHMPSATELQGHWDVGKIISLVMAVGLRPCTGALYVLAFALLKGVFWVGALAVIAMGLGTAITISLITTTVVAGRDFAVFGTASNSRAATIIYDLCVIGGALIILLFGISLFSTTLGPTRPF